MGTDELGERVAAQIAGDLPPEGRPPMVRGPSSLREGPWTVFGASR